MWTSRAGLSGVLAHRRRRNPWARLSSAGHRARVLRATDASVSKRPERCVIQPAVDGRGGAVIFVEIGWNLTQFAGRYGRQIPLGVTLRPAMCSVEGCPQVPVGDAERRPIFIKRARIATRSYRRIRRVTYPAVWDRAQMSDPSGPGLGKCAHSGASACSWIRAGTLLGRYLRQHRLRSALSGWPRLQTASAARSGQWTMKSGPSASQWMLSSIGAT